MKKKIAMIMMALCGITSAWGQSHGRLGTGEEVKEKVEMIKYGDFNSWVTRHIKESGIIGGNMRTIYAIGPTETIDGRVPYFGAGGSPWASSNVMAYVSGIYKTNLSVYKEPRKGHGDCAKLYTHIAKVKVLGLINIKVLAAGSIFLGQMMEPITSASKSMEYLNCGVRFSKKPKAIMFDYATQIVAGDRIKKTQFSSTQVYPGQDYADAMCILQRRWEDADGNIFAKRIGTMVHRFGRSEDWQNNKQFEIYYGDITQEPFYKSYMGLTKMYYAKNSKGEMVPIREIGWGSKEDEPTHLFVKFDSSHGGAFIGSVGNTLWLDNVRLVY